MRLLQRTGATLRQAQGERRDMKSLDFFRSCRACRSIKTIWATGRKYFTSLLIPNAPFTHAAIV